MGSNPSDAGTPRLSLVRLGIVSLSLVLVGMGLTSVFDRAVERVRADSPRAFFAPYVDVTLTPTFHFEDPVESPGDDVVLAFVVADPESPCDASWGGHYSLDRAARALDLDRRISRMRDRGGDVIVSFGGVRNDELAVACTDVDALTVAYGRVIARYGVTTIDLDIEGPALADRAANQRRAEAIVALQRASAARGDHLDVWLTVPVSPSGLTAEGRDLVGTMLEAEVDLAGVNVMTMNYGESREGRSMAAATDDALHATFVQLASAYEWAGRPLEDEQVWARIGATPMIGQNDVAGDVFGIAEAQDLIDLAARRGIGRISMWSVNRDGPCGAQVDTSVAQNLCSGVDQEPLGFSFQFSDLPGRSVAGSSAASTVPAAAIDLNDVPEASPYPVWRSTKVYVAGNKAVWHRKVYEAKWWTQGDVPDAPVEEIWDTPWRYLGPVLDGETAAPPTTVTTLALGPGGVPLEPPVAPVPTTAAPAIAVGPPEPWLPGKLYVEGERVIFAGLVYEARWWTDGEPPDPDPDTPWESPWVQLEE